ncbi:hypothetical protein Hz2V072 [Helicoverpa zea nudivirus 2]|uniref:Uncharacterized protein n=1 Tax=Helicoverpa zea nudivirus 2 TaxID=1128424 RepID=G9I098_HZNV2|nr:orf72 gene product [Helicoverpa zea nudivirus 2]AEW69621.1 hypothetical protein Hz2V072 [Helicoverpa zea nudivirus 2]
MLRVVYRCMMRHNLIDEFAHTDFNQFIGDSNIELLQLLTFRLLAYDHQEDDLSIILDYYKNIESDGKKRIESTDTDSEYSVDSDSSESDTGARGSVPVNENEQELGCGCKRR